MVEQDSEVLAADLAIVGEIAYATIGATASRQQTRLAVVPRKNSKLMRPRY